MSEYSQFIYGKFYNINAGYQLIACTSDLAQYQDLLASMAQKHFRFWGATPPSGDEKAVGIFQLDDAVGTFLPQDYSVLIQTEPASQSSGGSPYNQLRYIFIPKQDIKNESSLLSKLWNISIPIFQSLNGQKYRDDIKAIKCEYFQSNLLEGGKLTDENKNRENQELIDSLKDKKDNVQPIILSAISLLLNQYQIILTIDGGGTIIPQKFLQNILLFLPSNCRNLLSIAIGALDEDRCDWSNLTVKTNGNPDESKYSRTNIIWLNRQHKTFSPEIDNSYYQHPYVTNFISHIDDSSNSIRRMLDYLQCLTPERYTLDNLKEPEVLVYIIPGLLPGEKQIQAWQKYIPQVKNLQTVIDNVSDEESLFCLSQALELLHKKYPQQRQYYSTQILLIIQKVPNVLDDILNRLSLNLDLAIDLIFELPKIIQVKENNLQILMEICTKIIQDKCRSNLQDAKTLVFKFCDQSYILSSDIRIFCIVDAFFSDYHQINKLPDHHYTSIVGEYAYLLPLIDKATIYNSNFYKAFLSNQYLTPVRESLILLLENSKENLSFLLKISDDIGMNNQQTDKMCLSFLSNCPDLIHEDSLKLLRLLIERSIDKQTTPICIQATLFSQTLTWFKAHNKTIDDTLNTLLNNNNWGNWVNLAEMLYDNDREKNEFLDRNIQESFPVKMLTNWVSLIYSDLKLKEDFFSSFSWQNLSTEIIDYFISENYKYPQYIYFLSECLVENKALNLLKGDPLRFLCQSWIDNKIDSNLWNLLINHIEWLNPSDCLNLVKVKWSLNKDIIISLDSIALSDKNKNEVCEFGQEKLQNCQTFKSGQKILNDCHSLKLSSLQMTRLTKELLLVLKDQDLEVAYLLDYAKNKLALKDKEMQEIFMILQDSHDNPLIKQLCKLIKNMLDRLVLTH